MPAHNEQKVMTLPAVELLRRFAMHIVPPRFTRIRYYGFLANGIRAASLDKARQCVASYPSVRIRPAPSKCRLATRVSISHERNRRCSIARSGRCGPLPAMSLPTTPRRTIHTIPTSGRGFVQLNAFPHPESRPITRTAASRRLDQHARRVQGCGKESYELGATRS